MMSVSPDVRRFSQNIVLKSSREYSSEKDFRFLFQRETEREPMIVIVLDCI